MARGAIIGVSLTTKELKLVRERVKQGDYTSESDMIRDGLKRILYPEGPVVSTGQNRSASQQLAAAYRAMSAHDRKLAREWEALDDQWPNS